VKRKEGGRGLLQIEATYKAEEINTAEYLNEKYTEDQCVNIVTSHEINQPNTNSTIKVEAELHQPNENSDTKKAGIQHIQAKLGESLKKKLESEVMYGQYIRILVLVKQSRSYGCRGEI
jgi:hypothetical protein